jgi:O-antigen/teichoic acid export membrane protein
MAMAMVVVGLLQLINELGLTAGLIQRRTVERAAVRSIFGLAILVNIGLFLLLASTSKWVAVSLFKEPELQPLLAVLAIDLLLSSFALIPTAKLSREMNFRARGLVELATMFAASLTTLTLAISGVGVWALVIGHLTGQTVRVTALNVAARVWIPPSFRLRGVGELLRFGSLVTGERVLWYFYSQADVFLVGRVLGSHILGFYSVAMHLASLPMQKIAGILNEVGFAAFAKIQDDPVAVAENYLKAVRAVVFFAVPVFFGISAVAPEIIRVLLGTRWLPATVPLTILSVIGPLRMISSLGSPALFGIGRPDVSLVNLVIATIVMPTSFVIGLRGGLVGVSVAWLIAYPIVFIVFHLRSLRVLQVRYADFVRAIRGPVLAGGGMYLSVLVTRRLLDWTDLTTAARFPLLVAGGAFVYGSCMFFGQHARVREVIDVFFRRRRPAASG